VPLGDLLPGPAVDWLHERGARVQWGHRVTSVAPAADGGWHVDGAYFDMVVLACSATEAARLARPIDAAWADRAAGLDYQPIVTVYLASPGSRLPEVMTALPDVGRQPAQFVFDLGAIDGGGPRSGLFAFVASGARDWLDRGIEATVKATVKQALEAFPAGTWRQTPALVKAIAERRATFACRPALARPAVGIAPGLAAAGDFVQGPYPATLEGAVMSARPALAWLGLEAPPHLS
jgi:hydroxysqualene dehydroxylase